MTRILATIAILALLAGCNGITLSDVARAACVAQEAANTAGRIAERAASPEWVARFAEASRLAGMGCAW